MGKTKKVKGTKQTLEFTEEPKKFKVKAVKCKSKKQKEFLETIESHAITLCNGIPGSGKTFLACYAALKMLEKQQIDRIVLVKSVTTLPRGVRFKKPFFNKYGSYTSSKVPASSPIAAAKVSNPTGPP